MKRKIVIISGKHKRVVYLSGDTKRITIFKIGDPKLGFFPSQKRLVEFRDKLLGALKGDGIIVYPYFINVQQVSV